MDSTVRTTCPYCGVGCGILAAPDGSGGVAISGDPDHPANRGRLCSKGSALGETVGLDGRLLAPQINGTQAKWDTALDLVAGRFRDTIDRYGPDATAFYVSGQMLTEDYYVANKLMKGFIGSANIDTNSRLCMASTVAGHRRAFGADTVPGAYEDLEQADLVVLVGSNLAWCHPVLAQRLSAAKAARPAMKIVTIDPRRTATAEMSDMHLAIAPGGDVALFNRLLAAIDERGALDAEFVAAHVDGFPDALRAAWGTDTGVTGLPAAEIDAFLRLWLCNEKVVTVFSQGVNQSTSGTDKVNAILNCHLATGRIGKPGMGPFSVTGQPNAMGGREVGGLANMLACHLDLESPEHRTAVQNFWQSPRMPQAPGAKAVEMFRKVASGEIRALWIIGTNPAVSMPEADAVRDAIAGCDFTVVSDLYATTDTARLADVVLPATGWGEKDGTVTNSERCISRQRPFLKVPGEARPDWQILAQVACRMGWAEAFSYTSPAEIFREHARLSGIAAGFGRDFDISGYADISDTDYDAFSPARWPISPTARGGRFFSDGRFFTANGKAQMIAVAHRPPAAALSTSHPFRLNTGRTRDQWHTMTRTGLSPRLSQNLAEPFVEIHPEDARALGVEPATLVRLKTPSGTAILRAMLSTRVVRGQLFAPMHWSGEYASAARIDALVPAATDPVSGQPESKAAAVHLSPWVPDWYGFAVSASRIAPRTAYWARTRTEGGWRAELADRGQPANWADFLRDICGTEDGLIAEYHDPARQLSRVALLRDGLLVAALFTAPGPVELSRSHLARQLGRPARGALAGRAAQDQPDPGATICACLGVGVNTIANAIATRGLTSVEAVGTMLGAGTSCGSCRADIAQLITDNMRNVAAE